MLIILLSTESDNLRSFPPHILHFLSTTFSIGLPSKGRNEQFCSQPLTTQPFLFPLSLSFSLRRLTSSVKSPFSCPRTSTTWLLFSLIFERTDVEREHAARRQNSNCNIKTTSTRTTAAPYLKFKLA